MWNHVSSGWKSAVARLQQGLNRKGVRHGGVQDLLCKKEKTENAWKSFGVGLQTHLLLANCDDRSSKQIQ
jgi:hypothetical protein